MSICKRLLTIFHGYSNEQLTIFQELHLYCQFLFISLQTKLSGNVRQHCYKHLQWQRERSNVDEEYQKLDEKLLHSNLIAYAQQYVTLMTKRILSNHSNFLNATDPIRMISVKFLEPESDIEQVLEFLPGLSVSIPCLINAKQLDRQQTINIKVFHLFLSIRT